MNDSHAHARGWCLKAESDLAAAHQILAGEGPYDTACFHAQQAAEKYLKAFLAHRLQPIPWMHDLGELRRQCLAVEPTLVISGMDLAELSGYAVEIRYDWDFWPDQETARAAVEMAERVRDAVRAALPTAARP